MPPKSGTKRKLSEVAGPDPSWYTQVNTVPNPFQDICKAGGINSSRVRELSQGVADSTDDGKPVIYWMQRDQRMKDNFALSYAQAVATERKAPLLVLFNLVDTFLGAPIRHYDFMIKGLKETEAALQGVGIPMALTRGDPAVTVAEFVKKMEPGLLVTDFSPLRLSIEWKYAVSQVDVCPFHEVDAHNIVPVWVTSEKQEWMAKTIRPKIHKNSSKYLKDLPPPVAAQAKGLHATAVKAARDSGAEINPDWEATMKSLKCDMSIGPVSWIKPGEEAASAGLAEFIEKRLKGYGDLRNIPDKNHLSHLSPWLHYGNIAPQRVVHEVSQMSRKHGKDVESFVEECFVRRELSDNFCFYNPDYDKFEGLPNWAKESLHLHSKDKREYVYTLEELEQGKTHEDIWNAAQMELVKLGKIHGWCRMYWAKKILEWTESPEEALRISILLNDKYSLDGRDPNGYVGCTWSIGGVHDRGWTERPIFGKVRFMNYNGCKRKFDIAAYCKRVKNAK